MTLVVATTEEYTQNSEICMNTRIFSLENLPWCCCLCPMLSSVALVDDTFEDELFCHFVTSHSNLEKLVLC